MRDSDAGGPSLPLIAPGSRVMAPGIDAVSLDGSRWRLSDKKGKVVLIDFWATWCGPCRKTIPELIELRNELGPWGLEVVGISLDQKGPAVVDPFVKRSGINYPVVVDSQGRYARLYGGVDAIPTFFLVDRSGRTAYQMTGAAPKASMVRAIEALLQEG
ncbi:MAG: TlpA family protein disulfide reductase [Candidatus Eisenbacteria bacterium]|nr:TlpA family protein disulfide reductase [Candidatus Eisenbacteria bacterium]